MPNLSSGIFYHASPGKNEKSILSKGIDPKRSREGLAWVSRLPDGAYYEAQDQLATYDDDWIENLGGKGIIVFKVDLPPTSGIVIKYTDWEDAGYSTKLIPPKYISVHKRLGPDQDYDE